MTEAQFDCTKPFRTRDGREVCNFRFEGSVVGNRWIGLIWKKDGKRLGPNCKNNLDLVNVPEEPPRPADVADAVVVPAGNQVLAFARAILHGDEEHRLWLIEAAEAFVSGTKLPAPRNAPAVIPAADVREAQNDGDPIRRAPTGTTPAPRREGGDDAAFIERMTVPPEHQGGGPVTLRWEYYNRLIAIARTAAPEPAALAEAKGVTEAEVEAALDSWFLARVIGLEKGDPSYEEARVHMRAALEAARAVESRLATPMQDEVSEKEVSASVTDWIRFLASRTKGARG